MRPISPSLAGVLGALEPGPDLPEAAAQVDGVQRKDDDASRTTEGNQQRRSHDADGDGHDDESRAAHALDGHRLERAGEELDQSVEDLLGADQHDEKEGEGENRAGENHLKTPWVAVLPRRVELFVSRTRHPADFRTDKENDSA